VGLISALFECCGPFQSARSNLFLPARTACVCSARERRRFGNLTFNILMRFWCYRWQHILVSRVRTVFKLDIIKELCFISLCADYARISLKDHYKWHNCWISCFLDRIRCYDPPSQQDKSKHRTFQKQWSFIWKSCARTNILTRAQGERKLVTRIQRI